MIGQVEGIHVFKKTCKHCTPKIPYFYSNLEEYGPYNFNNTILVSVQLLVFLRNLLHRHTTPTRVFDAFLSEEELSNEGKVTWEGFEYVAANGKRKPMLVKKERDD